MFYNPVKIIKTNNWLEQNSIYQRILGIQNPLIITSSGNEKRLKLSTIFNNNAIFKSVLPNPTFENCQNAINFCQSYEIDGIIAIGGGSVMDTAKVIMASLGTKTEGIGDLFDLNNCFSHYIPSIFIPTTHGTGSEVTMWGTIWNLDEGKKYSISNKDLYPDVAILDPNLTITLSIENSIITSLDALSHGFESIWNKNANPQSTSYAINAICLILSNLKNLIKNPNDINLRRMLTEASNLAGLAISNTKTAAAHSISYPLTLNYNIPHGIASSIPLLPLLNINKNSILPELNIIIEKLELSNISELEECIRNIQRKLLKSSLKEFGVHKSDLQTIAKQSFTKGRMDNNIVDLTFDDVLQILGVIY